VPTKESPAGASFEIALETAGAFFAREAKDGGEVPRLKSEVEGFLPALCSVRRSAGREEKPI
jgi:hypothetical protein